MNTMTNINSTLSNVTEACQHLIPLVEAVLATLAEPTPVVQTPRSNFEFMSVVTGFVVTSKEIAFALDYVYKKAASYWRERGRNSTFDEFYLRAQATIPSDAIDGMKQVHDTLVTDSAAVETRLSQSIADLEAEVETLRTERDALRAGRL